MKENRDLKEYVDKKGHVRKGGILAWFKNFGYYYKSYIIAGSVFLVFFIGIVLSMNTVKPDLLLYYCVGEELTQDAFTPLNNNIYEYLIDIDRDDVVYLEPITLVLEEAAQKEANKKVEALLTDEDILCFVTDAFGYDYLMEIGALQSMAFFGIASGEEYRISLRDTKLWEEVDSENEYYFVMKKIDADKYEDVFISTMTTMIVDMCYDLVGEIPPEV